MIRHYVPQPRFRCRHEMSSGFSGPSRSLGLSVGERRQREMEVAGWKVEIKPNGEDGERRCEGGKAG